MSEQHDPSSAVPRAKEPALISKTKPREGRDIAGYVKSDTVKSEKSRVSVTSPTKKRTSVSRSHEQHALTEKGKNEKLGCKENQYPENLPHTTTNHQNTPKRY